MRIAEILAGKGRGVITLWPSRRLREAVDLLDRHHIASIVVVDPERRPHGIVSDREIIRAIARHGADALDFTVTHVMVAPPPMCTPETRVSEALRRMTFDRIRHLVVMHEEEMVGLVSIGDLIKVRLDDAEVEGRVLRDIALGHLATGR